MSSLFYPDLLPFQKRGKRRWRIPGHPFRLQVVKGDLFDAPQSNSLGHCISADASMHKGIATQFKRKFGRIDEIRKKAQDNTGLVPLKIKPGKFIYNLVTKSKCYHKPTYQSLEKSLEALRLHVRQHKVTQLALPKIGCGLDGLDWLVVQYMIEKIFSEHHGLTITIYVL